jgi:hypothetical protein
LGHDAAAKVRASLRGDRVNRTDLPFFDSGSLATTNWGGKIDAPSYYFEAYSDTGSSHPLVQPPKSVQPTSAISPQK